jgi:hypothetical protein
MDQSVTRVKCADPNADSQNEDNYHNPACDEGGAGTAFGTVCRDGTDHVDCCDPAPYCAVQPAQSEGYCTLTGCLDDASICPSDWGCMDLSVFAEGLPAICTAP